MKEFSSFSNKVVKHGELGQNQCFVLKSIKYQENITFERFLNILWTFVTFGLTIFKDFIGNSKNSVFKTFFE